MEISLAKRTKEEISSQITSASLLYKNEKKVEHYKQENVPGKKKGQKDSLWFSGFWERSSIYIFFASLSSSSLTNKETCCSLKATLLTWNTDMGGLNYI